MHSDYKCDSIAQLRDQQVRFAPRERKLEQVDCAERLLRDLKEGRDYNFEFISFRLTGFRPENAPVIKISTKDLRHDLLCFIEDLSEASNVAADDVSQPVHTVDDLSRMFNVSTKTISRWRRQGLVSRKFIFDGGRKRVGFLHTSVDQFVKNNREKVKRGERFSQLTGRDKEEIIERARRLAKAGGCPAEVTRRIASQMGRSVETIRYTIKQFDTDNPEISIFPNQTGPLNLEMKERIYADFLAGKSAESISRRYCRTRTTVYRVINDLSRDQRDASHDDHGVATGLHGQRRISPQSCVQENCGFPDARACQAGSKNEATSGIEQYLFRKYNFLKCKASKLRESLDVTRAKASLMDEVESLYDQAVKIKNRIVQSNLRLVVSIAKRHVNASEDFFQLVSDGNMSLIRAVEKFDYSRGNKFSTYASWAIMKNFARTIPGEFRQKERFRPTSEELFLAHADQRTDQLSVEADQKRREEQISMIMESLDDREQAIIISRFGLDYSQEPQTLKEVGAKLGVTKERIRQIEARAINKLRMAAEQEKIDLPDGMFVKE